jgi:PiT family inorganic phosphate transporter
MTSFARGLNDAPKIAALALPLVVSGGRLGGLPFVVVAIAMGMGSVLGGFRIARVLGEGITRLEGHRGLGANLATSLLVLGASPLGLPVSTTHVAAGAITGAGLSAGPGSISWSLVKEIVAAWVLTLPFTALVGAAAVLTLRWVA